MPLVVAGDGPDAARLRALAAGGEVRFAGWLSPQELADLRAQAAVVLVPSRSDEACPYSALDALAAGVPVLASDRGGLPELVGPDNVLPPAATELWGRRSPPSGPIGKRGRRPARRRSKPRARGSRKTPTTSA